MKTHIKKYSQVEMLPLETKRSGGNKNEMGGACGGYCGGERCAQVSGGET